MIKFKVQNQTLTRTDSFEPVADSRNYLTAEFEFSDEWKDNITAVFTHDGNGYQLRLENGKCTVPWEVIKAPKFGVSLFCGDLITTNETYVPVKKSGMLEGEAPGTPTPTLWQKYIAELAEKNSGLLDEKLGGAVNEAKEYTDKTADNSQKYADTGAESALKSAKNYTDTKTAAALDGAKSYTDEKIASSEIGKLADGAVTTAKIADNAVSEIKLDNSLKSKINGKADGFAINTSVTNNTLLLADKTETYLVDNAVATLTLTMPQNIGIGYRCAFGFKSGQTATDITFPQYEISWSGADCNSSKQFLPMPDTIYVIGVKCIGIGSGGKPIIYARVGVC